MERDSLNTNERLLAVGIRDRNEVTTGDFVAFELYDGANWRPAQISRTALTVLAPRSGGPLSTVFDENAEAIAAAGKRQIAKNPQNGKVVLGSNDF